MGAVLGHVSEFEYFMAVTDDLPFRRAIRPPFGPEAPTLDRALRMLGEEVDEAEVDQCFELHFNAGLPEGHPDFGSPPLILLPARSPNGGIEPTEFELRFATALAQSMGVVRFRVQSNAWKSGDLLLPSGPRLFSTYPATPTALIEVVDVSSELGKDLLRRREWVTQCLLGALLEAGAKLDVPE